MDREVIDNNILLIAYQLGLGEDEYIDKEVIDVYTDAGFEQDEIFLLLTAAKMLHQDRKNAPKPKSLFRRVS